MTPDHPPPRGDPSSSSHPSESSALSPPAAESRALGRSFLALSLGEAGARLLGFGATIFVARTLGAGAYGIIGVTAAARLYFVCLVESGIDSVGVREVAATPGRADSLGGALLAERLLVASVLSLGLAALALLALPPVEGPILAVYALSLIPVALNTRWLHLGLGDSRIVALARLGGELTVATCVLSAVRSAGDLAFVPLAQFLGDWVTGLLLAFAARRRGFRLEVRLDRTITRPILKLAWPLALHALLGLVIFNSDLLLLRVFRPLETVGQYAGAYTLVSFLLNLGVAYYQSLLPGLSRREEGRVAAGLYRVALRHAFAAGVPVAIGGLVLAGPGLALVFGQRFLPAAVPLTILLFSIPVAFLRNVAQAGLVAAGQTEAVLRASLVAVVVTLALNLSLIPPLGMLGGAISTLTTEVVRTGVALRYSGRFGYPGVLGSGLPRLGLAGFAMAGVLWLALPLSPWLAGGLGGICYLIVLFTVMTTGLGRSVRPT